MPKMKTKSGAKKRFRLTASGKIRGAAAFLSLAKGTSGHRCGQSRSGDDRRGQKRLGRYGGGLGTAPGPAGRYSDPRARAYRWSL